MACKRTFFAFAILIIAGNLPGQDSLNNQSIFPPGITIEYGFGDYSVKDQYISHEKYSGTLPYYSVSWARVHETYVYRLDMAYRNSNDLKNYNVSTNITQFTLSQGFLYPLGNIAIFQKDLYLWLGPSTEFFIFYNDQNIAVAGFDFAQSMAGLISLGLNLNGIYPLGKNLHLESSLKLTVLSFGFRTVDNEEDEESAVKLLTLFSGLNSAFDLGARYHLLDRLSVKLAYKLELTRISAWEPLVSASDNLIVGLTYRF